MQESLQNIVPAKPYKLCGHYVFHVILMQILATKKVSCWQIFVHMDAGFFQGSIRGAGSAPARGGGFAMVIGFGS